MASGNVQQMQPMQVQPMQMQQMQQVQMQQVQPMQQMQPMQPMQPTQAQAQAHVTGAAVASGAIERGWSLDLCGCCAHPAACVTALCCPCVVAGRVAAAVGHDELLCAAAHACLVVHGHFTFPLTCFLRAKLRAKRHIAGNLAKDCLVSLCCECCAQTQMAWELVQMEKEAKVVATAMMALSQPVVQQPVAQQPSFTVVSGNGQPAYPQQTVAQQPVAQQPVAQQPVNTAVSCNGQPTIAGPQTAQQPSSAAASGNGQPGMALQQPSSAAASGSGQPGTNAPPPPPPLPGSALPETTEPDPKAGNEKPPLPDNPQNVADEIHTNPPSQYEPPPPYPQ